MRVTLAVFLFSCCATFYACGTAGTSVPSILASPMSAADVQGFQMPGTDHCLSFQKAIDAPAAAKKSRSTIVDANILEDASPVSPAFINSVISNTTLSASPVESSKDFTFKQNGCESISILDHDGKETSRLKLIEATPTKLVTEKKSFQAAANEPTEYFQTTLELLSPHLISVRTAMPYTTGHDKDTCGINQEDHIVLLSSLAEFGDTLGTAPVLSQKLSDMKTQSAAQSDPANKDANEKTEKDYCGRIKAAR